MLAAAVVQASSGTASAASGPQLVAQPATALLNGQQVALTGSGFPPGTPVYLSECSDAAGQPTVSFDGTQVPVSCSDPLLTTPGTNDTAFVGPDGTFQASFTVVTGITGPVTLGLDSAGRSAAGDAGAYPCPPTAAQMAAGATCRVFAGQAPFNVAPGQASPPVSASAPISFGPPQSFSPQATATPATGLVSGQVVQVSGSGFTPDSPGLIVECNRSPGEPLGLTTLAFLPVGCAPLPQTNIVFAPAPPGTGAGPPIVPAPPPAQGSASFVTDSSGAVQGQVTIREGNLGSSANSAAYPCPPTAAQLAAGGTCQLAVRDAANDLTWVPIDITGPVPTPSLTVTPATGLYRGQSVEVTGANFTPLSQGGLVECSDAPGQPTMAYAGFDIPVSCTNPNGALTGISEDGTLRTAFTIATGVTGPPVPGDDSAGHPGTDDAAAYPCPPTAAQQAAGASCYLSAGDLAGDSARTNIAFADPATGFRLNAPVVAITARPDGSGYWMAAGDGGVFSFGTAAFYGSAAGRRLAKPIVGMAAAPDGRGYWLVGADGGIFTFGDAGFYGSAASQHPAKPIVGMAAAPDGRGYWLVGADGGVFSFGDAGFHGSAAAQHPAKPIVGMAPTPDGRGYWLVGADGGVFSFGDAGFYGSAAGQHPAQPIVGMAPTRGGRGYWLVQAGGAVMAFGDALPPPPGPTPPAPAGFGSVTAIAAAGGGYWICTSTGQLAAAGPAPLLGALPPPLTR